MIQVTRRDNGILILGHAGQNERGKDIVCAAASILLYALAETLQADAVQMRELDIDIGKGEARVFASPKEGDEARCRAALDVAWNGYRHLAHTYPDYIRVERL